MKYPIYIAIILFIGSCGHKNTEQIFYSDGVKRASAEEVEKLIESFIGAQDSTIIEIPSGFYDVKTPLILDNKKNITIRGKGIQETVLSFKNLTSGGEGIKLVGKNILIEKLTVEDAPGDGIKAQQCDTITFRELYVTWTNGNKSKNGTYAIYPVQCKNVLVDNCIAAHSRDAGIYVGQSENVIVKNSKAFGNVAGIEIENCDNSEVFDNFVYENAGGILVFNLPGLPKSDGKNVKIYRNKIVSNNHENFAVPVGSGPNGNTVTLIPPGCGIILLAAKNIEIFQNIIQNHKTIGISIANYFITGFPADAPNWSPYTFDIFIHNNEYKRDFSIPDFSKELGKLILFYNAHGFAKSQDIVYDGFWDKNKNTDIQNNPMNICIQEEMMSELRFTRFDLYGGADNIKSYKEYDPFVCKK